MADRSAQIEGAEAVTTQLRSPPASAAAKEAVPAASGWSAARKLWKLVRWLIALAVIGYWVLLFLAQASTPPVAPGFGVPFELWYGNWGNVIVASVVFLVFVLGFAWPRRPAEWRNAGMYSAFLISLFVEMFGVPLTIFLLAPFLGVSVFEFGPSESHLWASLLDWARVLPLPTGVYWVMTISLALIAIGFALVAIGWVQVYGARYRLVKTGIYRVVRHPQYLGLILVILAFNVQWPTIPTLLMAPVLIVMYFRQARREDRYLERQFGDEFFRYSVRVPRFIPRLGVPGRGLSRTREPDDGSR